MIDKSRIKLLKDLCDNFKNDIVDGPFGANLKREHYTSEGVPVLKIQNVKAFEIILKKMDYISSDKAAELQRHAYRKGDIIITKLGMPLGASAIVNEHMTDGVIVADLVRVRASKIDTRYLCYHLNSPNTCGFLNAQSSGATRPRVKISAVRELPIYTPPLPEQKRIVAILDEAFSGIRLAVVNAEKNLANARELFESYLNNIFTQKGDTWNDKLLSSTCIVERGSSPRPIKSFLTDDLDGVNWIKIGDTKGVVKSISSTKQRITKEGAKRSRAVHPGDFILTNSMSYGKPYIMATSGCIHDGWFVLRLAENINTDFFYYLLSSRVVQDQFSSLAAGAIVKNISGDLVKKTLLPIPPISEQEKLVVKIQMLSSETQRLETIYQQKLTALNELKQSILQKAFSGQLTNTNDNG